MPWRKNITKQDLRAKIKKLQAENRALKKAMAEDEHVRDAENAKEEAERDRDDALCERDHAYQELEELHERHEATCAQLDDLRASLD